MAQQRADLGALLPQLAGGRAGSHREPCEGRRPARTARRQRRRTSRPTWRRFARSCSDAQWKLSETTYYAPADGYVINLQLRPGSTVSQLPVLPVMSFVETGARHPRPLRAERAASVEPGNAAEIALSTYPGRIIKAKVDSIIWAQGQGQLPLTGTLPQTGAAPLPEGRFAVKLVSTNATRTCSSRPARAASARSTHIIFTPIHIIRKVLLRVSSHLNWIIIKHHISLH